MRTRAITVPSLAAAFSTWIAAIGMTRIARRTGSGSRRRRRRAVPRRRSSDRAARRHRARELVASMAIYAGASINLGRDPLQHRGVVAGPDRSQRSHDAKRQGDTQPEQHRISVRYWHGSPKPLHLLPLFCLSEQLPHFLFLLERKRIVDLLQNDHRIGGDRSNRAVRQLVAGADDVGLAVRALRGCRRRRPDFGECRASSLPPCQGRRGRRRACRSARISAALQQAHEWIAPSLRVVGESLRFGRVGLLLCGRGLRGGVAGVGAGATGVPAGGVCANAALPASRTVSSVRRRTRVTGIYSVRAAPGFPGAAGAGWGSISTNVVAVHSAVTVETAGRCRSPSC